MEPPEHVELEGSPVCGENQISTAAWEAEGGKGVGIEIEVQYWVAGGEQASLNVLDDAEVRVHSETRSKT